MENQDSKSTLSVLLAVIITAVVVGGGMYWWEMSQAPLPTTKSESDYTLSIDQDTSGASTITLKDTFNEGAGFSLHFPSSWGFVNVTKHNLTDSGGSNPPQRASYTFISEFRPSTHYLTVIISFTSGKDSSLVTQSDRVYITEDNTYYYNYNSSTQYCVEEGKCKADEIDTINAEIQEIIDSFKLL